MKIIFDRLSHDPDVRCVVLTGAGDRAFTAGLDVKVRLICFVFAFVFASLLFSSFLACCMYMV